MYLTTLMYILPYNLPSFTNAQMPCTGHDRSPDTDGQWTFLQETSLHFSFKATASLMSLLLLLLLSKYIHWLQIQLLLVYKYVVGQACLEIQMDRHLSLLARISVTWQCIQICTLQPASEFNATRKDLHDD